jgi:phthalate 4,5-dioxygenase
VLKPEENERISRVGAGTPMGQLLRRYWLPALLSEELPEADGAPVRVRLLGEALIAFRDTAGEIGLIDAFCPHRRAPLFFGRNEECGLRCVYHGWKFDRSGQCVDMPSEPPVLRQAQDDTVRKSKVTVTAYPTWEGGGMVWAYLGPPELQPAPPDFEVCRVPATHRLNSKVREACNYLQGLEGAVDSVHSGILHNDAMGDRRLLRNNRCEVEFDLTPYGLGGAAIHPLPDNGVYARSFHYVMPVHSIRGLTYDRYGAKDPTPTITGQIYVPIDDESCWVYSYLYTRTAAAPLSPEFIARYWKASGREPGDTSPAITLARTIHNNYLIDRQWQKTESFSGIVGMSTQDFAVQEGMGGICDRSKEHLAHSDQVIIGVRRLLFEGMAAVAEGVAPRAVDPADYRTVRGTDSMLMPGLTWRDALREGLLALF